VAAGQLIGGAKPIFSQIHEKQLYNYFWKYAQTNPLNDGVSSLFQFKFI
jgi:hypothetical protein